MSKRFTGTDIWSQDWYLDLPNEYKLFWRYILDSCDHGGFYKVNTKLFSRLIGVEVNSGSAVEFFNQDKARVRVISSTIWFLEDFIVFQYGSQLNPANRLHNSVLKLLGQFGVELTSIRGLKDLNIGLKDKDKDKDKDKSITKELDSREEKIYRTFAHLSITFTEVNKLIEKGYNTEQINEVLDAVQNYRKNKEYTSLFLTANKWLKKQFPDVTEPERTAKVTPIYSIDEPLPTRQVKQVI